MPRTETVRIGPRKPDKGYTLQIVRQYNTVDDVTSQNAVYVKYIVTGVVDVDIQDPYNMGSNEPESLIGVYFDSGHREYINGVIEDIAVDTSEKNER